MNKHALVLSCGGFKGAFQIGALRHLKKHWSMVNPGNPEMKFDIVAGVSVGSLNGVLTASGQFDELEKTLARPRRERGKYLHVRLHRDEKPVRRTESNTYQEVINLFLIAVLHILP